MFLFYNKNESGGCKTCFNFIKQLNKVFVKIKNC